MRSVRLQDKAVPLALSLFALNVADYVLTMWILRLGGSEVNPITDTFIRTSFAPILKIAVVGLVCVALVVYGRTALVTRFLAFVVAIYVAIVSWGALNLTLFYIYA